MKVTIMENKMLGFKAFNKDLRCKGFQYKIGETYTIEGTPIPCERGFHFCKSIADTYRYYPKNSNTRICIVEAIGDIETDDNIKFCTNKIKIIEEVTEEWKKKGNTNPTSTGYCNSGDYNTGDHNSGDHNSGYCNSGKYNSGNYNTGNRNSGKCNSGHCNIGNRNSGKYNSGNYNTGDWNSGSYNTGNYNSGFYNTGDWNTGDYSTGCFNTESEKIWMFNKPTELTYCDWRNMRARYILENMSSTSSTVKQEYWNELGEEDKKEILNLPNFDKDIFKKCTGIDVDSLESDGENEDNDRIA